MRQSSPGSIADRIDVPTLLGGGQADSLFPLAQVNATAEQIARANPDTPLKVVWHAARPRRRRRRDRAAPRPDGGLVLRAPRRRARRPHHLRDVAGRGLRAQRPRRRHRPGARPHPTTRASPAPAPRRTRSPGPPQQVLAPAGGVPAAITSLPGVGGLAALASSLVAVPLPNQSATFVSEPLPGPQQIAGAPTVRLSVSADTEVSDVTLFASLRTVGTQGRQTLPNGLVAPIRLESVGPVPTVIDVQLPGDRRPRPPPATGSPSWSPPPTRPSGCRTARPSTPWPSPSPASSCPPWPPPAAATGLPAWAGPWAASPSRRSPGSSSRSPARGTGARSSGRTWRSTRWSSRDWSSSSPAGSPRSTR